MEEKEDVVGLASDGPIGKNVRQNFEDIELVVLGKKPGCLELLTKAGPDRIPVIAPLLMDLVLCIIEKIHIPFKADETVFAISP